MRSLSAEEAVEPGWGGIDAVGLEMGEDFLTLGWGVH